MNATTSPKIRETVTLPAGRYVVGDPCYAIPYAKWMEWLEDADYTVQDRNHVLYATVNGYPCVGVSTMHGDGTYFGNNGEEFPVDAGLIGLVDVRCATDEVLRTPGTIVVDFPEPIECLYNAGTIVLGRIEIDTDDSYSEDECYTCAEPESACICGYGEDEDEY